MIIEPSAGSGAFIAHLPRQKTIGLDIRPLSPGIIKQDYFEYCPPQDAKKVLVIGNPPFGQRGKLAE